MPDEPKRPSKEPIVFERRKFTRIDASYMVSYTDVTHGEPRSDLSQTKNISMGGILFITDREYSPGTVLRVRLRIPDAPDYINAKVQVVISRQKIKGMMYDTSVKFIAVREEDREVIRKLIESRLKNKKG